MKKATTSPVRCAIYTRVSTEHGLEQDFSSLDAQHDAAQAYIRSQAHAGWTLIRTSRRSKGRLLLNRMSQTAVAKMRHAGVAFARSISPQTSANIDFGCMTYVANQFYFEGGEL